MNDRIDRKILLFSTASALALIFTPSVAGAQDVNQNSSGPNTPSDTPQSTESSIDNIIVTARRRNEKLQDVPQAISVMTQEQLKTSLVRDQNDLASKIPSLTVVGRFGKSGSTYSIRGLAGTNTPTVGTYFAEVPTPTNNIGYDSSAGQALYDLENVQVLKGPQGTLFGRSTTAGAVLVTPAAPNLNEVEANGSLAFGNLGYFQGSLAVSVPIINDVLAIRVAANHSHRRGYTKIIGTGGRLDGLNDDAQRVSVVFQPVSWFKNTTIYDRFHADQTSTATITVGYNPNLVLFNPAVTTPLFTQACGGAFAFGLTTSVSDCVSERLAIMASIQSNLAAETARTAAGGDELRKVNAGNSTYFIDRSTHQTVVNRTELTLPEVGPLKMQLKNIFGYQTTNGLTGLNVAGIPDDLVILYTGIGAGQSANQSGNTPIISTGPGNKFYSNETQLSGTLYEDRLVFAAGYYYQHAPSTPDLVNLGGIQKVFGGVTTLNLGYGATYPFTVGGRANQSAFYGQGTLSLDGLLDNVHVTAGVRHTKDDFLLRTAAATANPVTGVFTPSSTITTQALKTSGTNYNFSIDYKATPQLLVYVTTRKGYVPGGLNNSNSFPPGDPRVKYESENIKDVEAGFKWDFDLGGTRGRLNMAAYQAKYSNIQRPITSLVGGVATSYTQNAAKATLRGIEADLTVIPARNLTLGVSYAFSDAKYDSWIGTDPLNAANGNTDLTNEHFFGAPRHKLNLTAAYDIPLSGDNGTVSISGQYTYQSRTYLFTASELYIQNYGESYRDIVSQKAYGIANMRIDWHEPLGVKSVTAGVFARNLFDKIYATSGVLLNSSLGFSGKQFGEPRIVGANLSFQY